MRLRVACQINTKRGTRGNKQVTTALGLPTCRNLELSVRCTITCPLTHMLIYCSTKYMSVLCDGAASEDWKGKAVPLQAWAGTKCSRSLGLPYIKTFGI